MTTPESRIVTLEEQARRLAGAVADIARRIDAITIFDLRAENERLRAALEASATRENAVPVQALWRMYNGVAETADRSLMHDWFSQRDDLEAITLDKEMPSLPPLHQPVLTYWAQAVETPDCWAVARRLVRTQGLPYWWQQWTESGWINVTGQPVLWAPLRKVDMKAVGE